MKSKIFSPLIAGMLIGIAATVNLNVGGGIAGAVLFAFGLLGVVNWKVDLFTGKSGFWSGSMIWRLIPVLLLNIAGVALILLMTLKPETVEMSCGITAKRMSTPVLTLFGLSACCGMIMTTAVKFGREGNWWPLLFGVPTFILCGFPHCIADIAYWTADILNGRDILEIIPVYLVTVAGNYAGCNIPRLIPGFIGDAPQKSEMEAMNELSRKER